MYGLCEKGQLGGGLGGGCGWQYPELRDGLLLLMLKKREELAELWMYPKVGLKVPMVGLKSQSGLQLPIDGSPINVTAGLGSGLELPLSDNFCVSDLNGLENKMPTYGLSNKTIF
ncbi:hypothetical protein DSO57_1014926 [Entomophthora muscae]|uniref:Uncharacterized protein n=1 Tax=Entomophthora muscae TaxID=34485 RepID=A0ACC2U3I7_9FUNG|nr:hypothetical protein DSO57_1014926 [Entomophthora muscae]